MTDQDNLRDRIAEVIDPNAWKMHRIPNLPGWSESTELVEPSREKAQAIIDELGLTVETVNRKPNGGLCSKHCRDEEHAKNSVTRVVGKWERQ